MTPLVLAACLALGACALDAAPDPPRPDAAPPVPLAAVSQAPESAAGGYRFDRPVAAFTLPDELVEVSALTVLDAGHLGAVEDEDGVLFVLSAETGAVARRVPFGPPGDYEGIERVGDRLFVLRADGAVLELEGWTGSRARATVYETGLGAKDCDAEGLGADGARLLIACKEEDGDGRGAVWAFDLAAMALAAEPAYGIDREAVPGKKGLRPSALAVHPVTGHAVVLSSRRQSLVSLDAGGSVADVWDLEPAGFEQPEGLAFLPGGDVFVSSEGRDGPAVVRRYAWEPAGR